MGLFKKTRYRIRKEEWSDGDIRYICERTGFFRSNQWKVMTIEQEWWDGDTYDIDAIFDKLEDAEEFMGISSKKTPRIINNDVICTLQ